MVWKHDLRELKLAVEQKVSLNDSYGWGAGDREDGRGREEEIRLISTNCRGNPGEEEREERMSEDHARPTAKEVEQGIKEYVCFVNEIESY